MERKSYEYETIFSFHKDGASVWWPEPSHKRVHHGAKLGIIQLYDLKKNLNISVNFYPRNLVDHLFFFKYTWQKKNSAKRMGRNPF